MLGALIDFEDITDCRLCGCGELSTIFDLGNQALSGRFPELNEPDAPAAPLILVKCAKCGLVQLGHNFDPNEFYRHTYGYRSGVNETMSNHLVQIAQQITTIAKLKPGDPVLDIASNDATLLKGYSVPNLRKIGIDPTAEQYKAYYTDGIKYISDYFSASQYKNINAKNKARAITSIAMFYDLADPQGFTNEVASVLAEDGVWILEQSDIGSMLESKAFDTICHEHTEYYAFRQLNQIMETSGLRIFDLEYNQSNGGSMRLFVCHKNATYKTKLSTLESARFREEKLRLDNPKTYEIFKKEVEKVRVNLTMFLREQRAAGRTIHIYGASTKGNVLLQYCQIGTKLVAAASERNPKKFGKKTPGTGIPIISEEESRKAKPDFLLVLPWHFREEFIKRESTYLEDGGKLIFPLPNFEVYPTQ